MDLNEHRSLSREIARAVVSQLGADGSLVVEEGRADDLVADLEPLGSRVLALLKRTSARAMMEGLEDLVVELAEQLLESDHVEEVFLEDRPLRREIVRILREEMGRLVTRVPDVRPTVHVDLAKLPRYVVVDRAKLDGGPSLRAALQRAAEAAGADLTRYDADGERASFERWNEETDGDRPSLVDAVAEELAHAGFARFTVDLDEAGLGAAAPTPTPTPTPTRRKAAATRSPAVATFQDFNFKLVVVQALMYATTALRPRFDRRAFAARKGLNIDDEEGLAAAVRAHFAELVVPVDLLRGITTLTQDGGDRIYAELRPDWDGEDGHFVVRSAEDARWLPNLKKVTLLAGGEDVLAGFRSRGIAAEWT